MECYCENVHGLKQVACKFGDGEVARLLLLSCSVALKIQEIRL